MQSLEKTYIAQGSIDKDFCDTELEELFSRALSTALADTKVTGNIIVVPPDISRIHSKAGFFTELCQKKLDNKLAAVLPALGTHSPMNENEITQMFGEVPKEKFITHNWRDDITELGRIEESFIENLTEGAVRFDWPVQINKLLCKDIGGFSLIVSIGQVVPHEVAGMANHSKNIFIGTGGKETIDKSHFVGAAYGMEKIMGKVNNPVRSLFNEGCNRFGSRMPPILWVLTVVEASTLNTKGLYIGFGNECFEKAAQLAQKININKVEEPLQKTIVSLPPNEYKSTWLGNKAIYRTRMAMQNGGELIILAPALERFGEDPLIDAIIRKHGYVSREKIIETIKSDTQLSGNLCAAAHLIHGSSEGRFTIRYCPGKKISKEEILSVGYKWGSLEESLEKYNTNKLKLGPNTLPCGEQLFFIDNPGLGLWTC